MNVSKWKYGWLVLQHETAHLRWGVVAWYTCCAVIGSTLGYMAAK